MSDYPTPTNGQPYYCKVCGLGFDEYMSCELSGCELESKKQAELRANQPTQETK